MRKVEIGGCISVSVGLSCLMAVELQLTTLDVLIRRIRTHLHAVVHCPLTLY